MLSIWWFDQLQTHVFRSWVWTPTPGNPGTQTVLSGPFGSPNDCARAVNRECPTHTYAYYTEDAEDASNHACACQTILGTVVRVRCMSNFDIILGPDLDRVFRRSIPPHSPSSL